MNLVTKLDDEEGRLSALCRYNILDTGNEERFDRITKIASMALDVPITLVSLVDADRQWFKSNQGLKVNETARNISFCTHTIQNSKPLIIENATQDARFSQNPLVTGDPNIRSYLGVPLLSPDGYNIGTLCAIDTAPRKFSNNNIELLSNLGELVIHELELRQEADTDSLTGALNRRAFAGEVQRTISLFERENIDSALLLFDLDHFKQVNDKFGHSIGDEVLRSISAETRNSLSPTDVFARVGGEEFAILMTGTKRNEAIGAADHLRKNISNCRFDSAPDLKVTASFGITKMSNKIGICSDWLKRADNGLYAAKRGGRNMICEEAS